MGVETAIATAAIVSAVAAAGSAGYSMYQGEKANKQQKKEAQRQQAAIDEQNAMALSERKQRIDQMRMQMAGTGAGTRGTSSAGIKARIGGGLGGNTLG